DSRPRLACVVENAGKDNGRAPRSGGYSAEIRAGDRSGVLYPVRLAAGANSFGPARGRKNKAFTAFSASHRHDFSSALPTKPTVVGRLSDGQTFWSCVHRHKQMRRQQIEGLMIPTFRVPGEASMPDRLRSATGEQQPRTNRGKKRERLATPENAAFASSSVAQSLVMPNAIAPVRRMTRHSSSG